MKAVVLAAGEGKRIRAYTKGIAKEMIPLYGKPFLEYILEILKDAGLREIIIVINKKKQDLRDYFGDGKRLGLKINYCYQEKQLGTAHAILTARKFLKAEKYFLVQYGDSLTNVNLPKMTLNKFFKNRNLDAYVVLRPTKNVSRYGIVKFGKDRKIIDIVEKPEPEHAPSNKAILGIFILKTKSFFDSTKGEKFLYGKEVVPPAYIVRKGGIVKSWIFSQKRVDLGKYYDIKKSRELIKKFWPHKSVHAIVFDADNTLYETRKIAKFAYAAAMKILSEETGLKQSFLDEDLRKTIKFLRKSKIPRKRTFVYCFNYMTSKYKLQKSIAKKMYVAFEREIIKRLKRKAGAKKVLDVLKKDGIKIIISTDEAQKDYLIKKLSTTKVKKFIDFIVSSDDTNQVKPSSRFYEVIKKRTDLRYNQMLSVGDDYEKDLKIPEKLGMKTILITDKEMDKKFIVIKDFSEFLKKFDFYLYLKTKNNR